MQTRVPTTMPPSNRRLLMTRQGWPALGSGLLWVVLGMGCAKSNAVECDADVLRREVARAHALRAEHPAWFGDLGAEHDLGYGLARDVLVRACSELPPELRQPIDRQVAVSQGQRLPPLEGRPPAEQIERYAKRRARICKDATVFDELPTLPPAQRGPEMARRCQLEKVGLGDATHEVVSRIGLAGLMTYQLLLDADVPAEVARDAMGLFAYPVVPGPVRATLPNAQSMNAALMDGLAIHISATEVSLPGGPSLPLSGGAVGDAATLRDWLTTELDAAYGDSDGRSRHVNLFAQADAPASAVASTAASLPGPTYVIVVRLDEHDTRAELVADDRRAIPPSYVLTATEGQLEVRNTATEEVELRTPLDDPSPLEGWAAGISSERSVEIRAEGLTVQQFVVLRHRLRGSECDLIVWKPGEEPPPDCNVIIAPLRG